jgi:cell wall-associated NlpC family hydrolase
MLRLLAMVAVVLLSGCASTGWTPQPFPVGRRPGPEPSTAAPATVVSAHAGYGYAVAGTALALRGSPYRNGGADPGGFDCSGFVRYVFDLHGLDVPRSVGEQFRSGRAVATDALEPGDLVFFTTTGSGASHVGIAIGSDEFVHAPSTNGVVRVDRIGGGYWASRFVGARRLAD